MCDNVWDEWLLPVQFIVNPLHTCTRVTVVVLSVCVYLSVKLHLTSGVSVHPENAVTYSVDNLGRKISGAFGLFPSGNTYVSLPSYE